MLQSAKENNEPIFIIRAKDKHSTMLLETYLEECEFGSPKNHIEEIKEILSDFKKWQKENPDKIKIPD